MLTEKQKEKAREIEILHSMSLLAKERGDTKEYKRLRNILRVNACIFRLPYTKEKP